MIDFLLGVPGKLKTISDHLTNNLSSTRTALIDNWTAVRAAKLDFITVAPAPASTAVSNADLTPTRAANLDNLEMSPISRPPIAANWQTPASTSITADAATANAIAGTLVTSTESASWQTALSITGSGVLNFLATGSSVSGGGSVRLTIDGVQLFSDATPGSKLYVGTAGSSTSLGIDQIPFRSGLLIEFAGDGVTTGIAVVYKARRTS